MKIRVQVVIETDNGEVLRAEEVACLARDALHPETLGLKLVEGKTLLARLQEVVAAQQGATYETEQRACPDCAAPRALKGHHSLVYRTLFGVLRLASPRFYTCACQGKTRHSVSPLAELLTNRSSPELRYLQSKWAALTSYGASVKLLDEVLPLTTNRTAVFRHTQQVAERLESELGPEQVMFADGCEREWAQLPEPDEPLTVGIDGGYVHARAGENCKAGWFEVIVGKSLQSGQPARRFAFVNGYDEKPKRRLWEVLQAQGLQMNQTLTFLSDGGDTVRDLQFYLSPQAQHLLDWFHITMRLTVLKQMARGLSSIEDIPPPEKELERIKHYLWHGNVFKALELLEGIAIDVGCYEVSDTVATKLAKKVEEFHHYISANQPFIPNYGERYRYGEIISTAFVEATVNEVISRRMVKKQQMRWTRRGAHLLLQVRIRTLDNDLRPTFERWYPAMGALEPPVAQAA